MNSRNFYYSLRKSLMLSYICLKFLKNLFLVKYKPNYVLSLSLSSINKIYFEKYYYSFHTKNFFNSLNWTELLIQNIVTQI